MRTKLVIIFTLLAIGAQAQIIFFNSLEKAREFAREQNKGTFIEVCTRNNKKCNKLEQEVYSDREVADILNLNFINVRIDPDVDRNFEKTFEIKSVPTLIFIGKDGMETDRISRYKESSEVIKAIKNNARKISQINELRREYMANQEDNILLKTYYSTLKKSGFSNDARRLLTQYFYNLGDEVGTEEMEFILHSADHYRSPSFQYILDDLSSFDARFGRVRVSEQLMGALISGVDPDKLGDPEYLSRRIAAVFRGYDDERFHDAYVISSFSPNGGTISSDEFCESGFRRLQRLNCTEMDYINNFAVSLMLEKREESYLRNLEELLSTCFEETQNINTLDLQSVLLYKLGEKESAIQLVQKASQLAHDQKMKFVSSLRYFKDLGFIE